MLAFVPRQHFVWVSLGDTSVVGELSVVAKGIRMRSLEAGVRWAVERRLRRRAGPIQGFDQFDKAVLEPRGNFSELHAHSGKSKWRSGLSGSTPPSHAFQISDSGGPAATLPSAPSPVPGARFSQ